MIEQETARPWGGPTNVVDAPDDDLLRRLALWLADVSAEAALAATPPERATTADSTAGESGRGEPAT
jgi:hypothetical protein